MTAQMTAIVAFLSIIRKELTVWRRSPVGIVVILLPPLLILGLLALAGASVSSEPVALVVQSQGPYSLQMASSIQQGQQFRVVSTNYSHAEDLFRNLQVAGIVVIPSSFDSSLTQHKHASLTFLVNNVDADSTNDLRRGIAIAVTDFNSKENASSANLNFQMSYLKPTDVSLLQYQSVGAIVLLLLTSGLTGGSLAGTREWENKTIRELLLAPESLSAITVAKVVSNMLTSLALVSVIVAILIAGDYLMPASGPEWAAFVSAITLTSLFSSSLGVMLANLIKKGTVIIGLSINVSFLLFFLTGGLAPVPYLPTWAQEASKFVPIMYTTSAIDEAALYLSLSHVPADLIVLCFSAALALIACLYVSLTVGSRG